MYVFGIYITNIRINSCFYPTTVTVVCEPASTVSLAHFITFKFSRFQVTAESKFLFRRSAGLSAYENLHAVNTTMPEGLCKQPSRQDMTEGTHTYCNTFKLLHIMSHSNWRFLCNSCRTTAGIIQTSTNLSHSVTPSRLWARSETLLTFAERQKATLMSFSNALSRYCRLLFGVEPSLRIWLDPKNANCTHYTSVKGPYGSQQRRWHPLCLPTAYLK